MSSHPTTRFIVLVWTCPHAFSCPSIQVEPATGAAMVWSNYRHNSPHLAGVNTTLLARPHRNSNTRIHNSTSYPYSTLGLYHIPHSHYPPGTFLHVGCGAQDQASGRHDETNDRSNDERFESLAEGVGGNCSDLKRISPRRARQDRHQTWGA